MTSKMLQERYLSVTQAQTPIEFRKEIIKFGQSLGFQTVSGMTVIDHSLTHTDFYCVDNTPSGYAESFSNVSLGRADPVMQHCKYSSIPLIWDQEIYINNNCASIWEEQANYGLRNGIALALHLPNNTHFFIGVDRDKPICEKPHNIVRMVADLQLFAVHAQESALRLFAPRLNVDNVSLTPREIEALRWTMDGNTAWQIGQILNISERTAVFHLQNAMRKLKCQSKYQAVMKAIRIGLLS